MHVHFPHGNMSKWLSMCLVCVWHQEGQCLAPFLTSSYRGQEGDPEQPVCRVCGKRVIAKASNTTNLFQHLHKHHPTVYTEIGPMKPVRREWSVGISSQATLNGIIMKSAMYNPSSPQAKDLNRAIDAKPLCTVDKPGFQFMISKLNTTKQECICLQ